MFALTSLPSLVCMRALSATVSTTPSTSTASLANMSMSCAIFFSCRSRREDLQSGQGQARAMMRWPFQP